jgi:hypothetical protein
MLASLGASCRAGELTLQLPLEPGWFDAGLVSRYEEFTVDIELLRAFLHESVVRRRIELGD